MNVCYDKPDFILSIIIDAFVQEPATNPNTYPNSIMFTNPVKYNPISFLNRFI